LFLIFFIGSIAETNRAPFDLAEANKYFLFGLLKYHRLLENLYIRVISRKSSIEESSETIKGNVIILYKI
jgi:hypothetical protein